MGRNSKNPDVLFKGGFDSLQRRWVELIDRLNLSPGIKAECGYNGFGRSKHRRICIRINRARLFARENIQFLRLDIPHFKEPPRI